MSINTWEKVRKSINDTGSRLIKGICGIVKITNLMTPKESELAIALLERGERLEKATRKVHNSLAKYTSQDLQIDLNELDWVLRKQVKLLHEVLYLHCEHCIDCPDISGLDSCVGKCEHVIDAERERKRYEKETQ